MRIMVTGAAGLLGRYVTRSLLARGDEVVAVDMLCRYRFFGDHARAQPVPREIEGARFVEASFDDLDVLALLKDVDVVVHAAAQTSHPRSIAIPLIDFQVNALGTLRLLEALRELGPANAPRLVHISTAKVYGEKVFPVELLAPERSPCPEKRFVPWLNEEFFPGNGFDYDDAKWNCFSGVDGVSSPAVNERCPLGDQTILTPFGVSKLAADLYCQQYARLYGLDVVVLRPGCFTGRGALAVEEQNWAPQLVRAIVRGELFMVYGYRGRQVRSLLHVDDLTRAVIACVDAKIGCTSTPIDNRWNGDVFNVDGGPGNDVSILEAVDLIRELTGHNGELCFEAERPGDWPWYVGSNRKISNILGWMPRIGVRETFRELCNDVIKMEPVA